MMMTDARGGLETWATPGLSWRSVVGMPGLREGHPLSEH